LDGTGQTIAIIGDSIPSTGDLTQFCSYCNIWPSTPRLTVQNVQGGPGSDTNDQFELAMDVEWASGIAPQANILLYAVPYPMRQSTEAAAYTQILNDLPSNPNLHQVTESYAGLEANAGNGDNALLLLVAQIARPSPRCDAESVRTPPARLW
jgi:subtilase family serine protease